MTPIYQYIQAYVLLYPVNYCTVQLKLIRPTQCAIELACQLELMQFKERDECSILVISIYSTRIYWHMYETQIILFG